MDGGVFQDSFWTSSPFKKNDEAELGIAALAKGNFVTAEGHFQRALRANPKDIDALLGAGILYQNTGQVTKARQMYEAVLALRPDDGEQFVVWNTLTTRPASQVASVNLSLLESGGTGQAMAASAPGTMPGMSVAQKPSVMGAPTSDVMLGRASAPAMANAAPMSSGMSSDTLAIGKFASGDASVV
ncbi:MAG: tetratricopeptide repeat protein, partial [Proteobacteria bacterium]|nr:tetratricopeptide repeat protein [Pseudomonadota bacterium]